MVVRNSLGELENMKGCLMECDTYPSWTGPKVLCRAIESSLMRALVIESVGFIPPSCCSTQHNTIRIPIAPTPHTDVVRTMYHRDAATGLRFLR